MEKNKITNEKWWQEELQNVLEKKQDIWQVTSTDISDNEDTPLCSECENEISGTEKLYVLGCQHFYHQICLEERLDNNNTDCKVCDFEFIIKTDTNKMNEEQ